MFLRRLSGWLPRPWGRRKPAKPDSTAPEPRWVDSSPENSGSDWDSAPETMGDVGPPKTKDSGTPRRSGAAPEPSREPRAEQLGSKGMDSLQRNKAESERLEAAGALGMDPMDAGGTRRPEEELSIPGPEAAVENASRHQQLLGWLRGEAGGPPRYLGGPEECLQISTNLTLHLLELLASALLALCSRPLRAALDALGLRGPLGLWLHGLLSFVAALHGLHAVLSLLTAHPLHFACLFGLLQALVLAVSLREPSGDEEATDWEGERTPQRRDRSLQKEAGKLAERTKRSPGPWDLSQLRKSSTAGPGVGGGGPRGSGQVPSGTRSGTRGARGRGDSASSIDRRDSSARHCGESAGACHHHSLSNKYLCHTKS